MLVPPDVFKLSTAADAEPDDQFDRDMAQALTLSFSAALVSPRGTVRDFLEQIAQVLPGGWLELTIEEALEGGDRAFRLTRKHPANTHRYRVTHESGQELGAELEPLMAEMASLLEPDVAVVEVVAGRTAEAPTTYLVLHSWMADALRRSADVLCGRWFAPLPPSPIRLIRPTPMPSAPPPPDICAVVPEVRASSVSWAHSTRPGATRIVAGARTIPISKRFDECDQRVAVGAG